MMRPPSPPKTGRHAEGFLAGVGYILVAVGALAALGAGGSIFGGGDVVGMILLTLVGLALLGIGVPIMLAGRAIQKTAAYVRAHGAVHVARVVGAERTGMEEGDVPVYALSLEIAAPDGVYTASTNRIIPEHQVALLMHQEVRVRVHPQNPLEVVIDDPA